MPAGPSAKSALSLWERERVREISPSPRAPIGVKRKQRDKMAARDSRRDCRIGSSLSLRERDLGVRVQSLLNPDAEVEDIPTLTPALSRRERVVYAACFRLMPMPPAPLRDGEGSRR